MEHRLVEALAANLTQQFTTASIASLRSLSFAKVKQGTYRAVRLVKSREVAAVQSALGSVRLC